MTAHRPRRSTWLLMALFLLVLALYVMVRPVPAGTTPVDLRQQVRPAAGRGPRAPDADPEHHVRPEHQPHRHADAERVVARRHRDPPVGDPDQHVGLVPVDGARPVRDVHARADPLLLGLGRYAGPSPPRPAAPLRAEPAGRRTGGQCAVGAEGIEPAAPRAQRAAPRRGSQA